MRVHANLLKDGQQISAATPAWARCFFDSRPDFIFSGTPEADGRFRFDVPDELGLFTNGFYYEVILPGFLASGRALSPDAAGQEMELTNPETREQYSIDTWEPSNPFV